MNVERGASNTLLVNARQVAGETHYLLVFTFVSTQTAAKCITTNTGKTTGPLLLQFDEVDGGVATNGDVELAAGDWKLEAYAQGSSTNLDTTLTLRGGVPIWTEQVRVTGEDGTPPEDGACLTLVEQITAAGASGTVDAIDDAALTEAVQALICEAEACPMDIVVTVDGDVVETITDVDPCEANTLNIAIEYS